MKQYKLLYTMKSPSEETEDMYLAEVPALPGCRAWGNTSDEALSNLRSVASAFIESYHEHGDELPDAAKTTIPNWGSKDLRAGTVRPILRDLGIDKSAFHRS